MGGLQGVIATGIPAHGLETAGIKGRGARRLAGGTLRARLFTNDVIEWVGLSVRRGRLVPQAAGDSIGGRGAGRRLGEVHVAFLRIRARGGRGLGLQLHDAAGFCV